MKAPAFWGAFAPTLAARALQPLGAVYGAMTLRRMARSGTAVSAPVICVGNFVAGGAGKTPVALALGERLAKAGRRVAFLSRGYGGAKRADPLLVDPSMHDARQVGDEPLLLARVAPCFVGPDRVASARLAIAEGANALVMDDGLQNPSLAKALRIAVVDAARGFGNGLCVPAGPLRAPMAGQRAFADAVVLIEAAGARRADLSAIAGLPIFAARLEADAFAASALIGRPVLAFAGIGAPEKFYATLRGIGAQVAATRAFADHHLYSSGEIEAILREARMARLMPVTTEKDAMRIPAALLREISVLPVALRFDDEAAVAAMLARSLLPRADEGP